MKTLFGHLTRVALVASFIAMALGYFNPVIVNLTSGLYYLYIGGVLFAVLVTGLALLTAVIVDDFKVKDRKTEKLKISFEKLQEVPIKWKWLVFNMAVVGGTGFAAGYIFSTVIFVILEAILIFELKTFKKTFEEKIKKLLTDSQKSIN